MKIPASPGERAQFYQDIISQCQASRQARRDFYRLMRMYYLFGTADDSMIDMVGRFNNIMPHMDQLSSFMFSPETTRFSIDIGPSVNSEEYKKVAPLIKGIHREWHGQNGGGIDVDFKNTLDWAGVYGTMLMKFRWKNWKRKNEDGEIEEAGETQHFLVYPHNFGVFREDKRGLHKQEAFTESYHITKTQLENELRSAAHPNTASIIDAAQVGSVGTEGNVATGQVDRLIVTALQGGSITGTANMTASNLSMMYTPTVTQDLIEMTELYVYDDSIADYRIVTWMHPNYPIWDRPLGKIFIPGTSPYVQVCPRPMEDYFWGASEVEKLIPLQDMLNERIMDIRHMLKMQAHPSNSVTGETAIPDEMQMALDTPSGILALGSPAATIKQNTVTIPQDLWRDVQQVKEFFGEISGLPPVNQGQGVKGVRSEGHAQMLSQLGSTRPKNRALIVEESLDDIATLVVKILKRYDPRPYAEDAEGGKQFFARQFTDDFVAKVDGHTSSPVFMENFENKVWKLLEMGIINKQEALMLLDIPLKELLKQTLVEKIEPAEAKAHEDEMNLKRLSIASKRQK
jgi:hypothetical protein